ncbi:DUF1552 domain-containing protein [Rubinisphaera margarita]|uniref:DUF1552 domain-containing protein n=1 Tax=Rubinisphaera margarita TaxID=2909586 RepID=UPI001EE8E3D3|nr:DUF1552 domain-containing protein [Rubinisphaera margarita]MCG6155566.1 DUF1552 domain-containing protein [Rubinisphaera margarita]
MMHTQHALNRRGFLRSAGACLTLPWLECLVERSWAGAGEPTPPRRMIAIMTDLGIVPEYFFPEAPGRDFKLTPYLQVLAEHRDQFTVFSGLSHPEVTGGHQTDLCFLTGAPHPRKPGFKNSISLDQYAAMIQGPVTRFPSLTLRVGPSNKSLSYSADGVAIPSEFRPSSIYRQLFLQGSPREVEAQIARLREGQSLMDQFEGRLQSLERKAGKRDRQRLDQFLTSVREVEQRLEASEAWEQKPKPRVDVEMPKDNLDPTALVERTRAIYDLSRLAIETDSTRLITVFVTQQFNPKVDLPGVEMPHHALTHQMSLEESREQLRLVEEAQFGELNRLLTGLRGVGEGSATMLDQTMVLYGSNLGNASRHDTTNLPVLLAGGGFRHGQHLAFSRKNNYPLANLYVSMLQRMGIETDRFSSGMGTMTGLDFA